jgi:hypothetical protein
VFNLQGEDASNPAGNFEEEITEEFPTSRLVQATKIAGKKKNSLE